jgi:hypothetical protein
MRAVPHEMSEAENVEVRLGRKSDGLTTRHSPFMVISDNAERCSLYSDEPTVIAQLLSERIGAGLKLHGTANGLSGNG